MLQMLSQWVWGRGGRGPGGRQVGKVGKAMQGVVAGEGRQASRWADMWEERAQTTGARGHVARPLSAALGAD